MLLRGKLRHLSLGHDLIQAEGLNKAPDEEFGDGFAAIVLANLIKNIGARLPSVRRIQYQRLGIRSAASIGGLREWLLLYISRILRGKHCH